MSVASPAPRAATAKRARNSVPLVPEAGKDAKRLAAVVLEVWAGLRTPLQAAEALGVSLPRYYQIEANGLQGLVAGCTPKPKGRQANPTREATALRRPSSENASALSATSRPSTSMATLSRTAPLSASALRAARSLSMGRVLVQAAKTQRTTRRTTPGHHLALHLKSPCIRYPVEP